MGLLQAGRISVPNGNITKVTDINKVITTEKLGEPEKYVERKVFAIEIEQEPIIKEYNTEELKIQKAELLAQIEKIDNLLTHMED